MKQIIFKPLYGLLAVFLLLLMGGCGTSTSKPTTIIAKEKNVKIEMKNMVFTPASIEVAKGSTVTWLNDDNVTHTVTSGTNLTADGKFDSKDMPTNKTFSHTFNETGTYPYYCKYHGNMTGTVTVVASEADLANTKTRTSKEKVAPAGTGTANEPLSTEKLRYAPYTLSDGYKVFHLTAQAVTWEVKQGQKVTAWAYNGTVPGPVIQVNQGDKVKIEVTNKLTEGTTVHWHGLDVPFAQDGSGGISQPDIKPGQTWTYTFTVNSTPGTYMYHSHPMKDMLKQDEMGLFGAFIVEPAGTPWRGVQAGYQREYTLVVNDSSVFGYTINGYSFPATPVLPAKVGEKILIHVINTGSMEHPLHLHGMHFQQISQDGVPLPAPITMDTLSTSPGTTYDLSLVASQAGKWLFHCHITSHVTDSNGNMTGMVTMFNVQK